MARGSYLPMTTPRAMGGLPRFRLAFACAAHAAVYGWACAVLPWREGTLAAVLLGAMAALHIVTLVFALFGLTKAATFAWRAVIVGSLLFLAVGTWAIASSALYILTLYTGVGQVIAAALVGFWGLLVLFTLPLSIWGFALVWRRPWSRPTEAAVFAVFFAVCFAYALALSVRSARAFANEHFDIASTKKVIETTLAPLTGPISQKLATSLLQTDPANCARTPSRDEITLLVTYATDNALARTECLQAQSPEAIGTALRGLLAPSAPIRPPIKIDIVRGISALTSRDPVPDALKLRPGQDGICAGHYCFMPWQLVATDAFTSNRPFDAVKDASFGFNTALLATALHNTSSSLKGMTRIDVESLLFDEKLLTLQEQARLAPAEITQEKLARAVVEAEHYILSAQQDDGSFRYTLNPYTGTVETAMMSIARQAGTTMALCENEATVESNAAIARALVLLAQNERNDGHVSTMNDEPNRALLGRTALPLIAFLTCRSRLGRDHDALIARLSQFVLQQQRPNGSFYPEYNLSTHAPAGNHEILYAAGQAVLSLVLLEQSLHELQDTSAPSAVVVRSAIDRAFAYYAGPYWHKPMYNFFFIEENWHCLAARAALTSHRHAAYEQFCLDYVRFKSRFIVEDASDSSAEGGFSLSPVFPAHTTNTAGFGEALAAAMAIKKARGESIETEDALMKKVLAFLLRVQWNERNCFACTRAHRVIGGFSEHNASPVVRIDYVQHAMSAMLHGGHMASLPR